MQWGAGIMEFWKVGFSGLRSNFIMGCDQKLKLENHPLLIPNIPFFHHSIIPLVTQRQTPPFWLESKPESLTRALS
jgi:hypothetical protein